MLSLWFSDNNCEEAINYYVSIFPNSKSHSSNIIWMSL
ncbi:VOC family protein [Ruoffia tabacinasalis]